MQRPGSTDRLDSNSHAGQHRASADNAWKPMHSETSPTHRTFYAARPNGDCLETAPIEGSVCAKSNADDPTTTGLRRGSPVISILFFAGADRQFRRIHTYIFLYGGLDSVLDPVTAAVMAERSRKWSRPRSRQEIILSERRNRQRWPASLSRPGDGRKWFARKTTQSSSCSWRVRLRLRLRLRFVRPIKKWSVRNPRSSSAERNGNEQTTGRAL